MAVNESNKKYNHNISSKLVNEVIKLWLLYNKKNDPSFDMIAVVNDTSTINKLSESLCTYEERKRLNDILKKIIYRSTTVASLPPLRLNTIKDLVISESNIEPLQKDYFKLLEEFMIEAV